MKKYTKKNNQRKITHKTHKQSETRKKKLKRLKKIRNIIRDTFVQGKGFFGLFGNKHITDCLNDNDLTIPYPYTEPRTCLQMKLNTPIHFDSMKQKQIVEEKLGEPLGFEFVIDK
jgi:hypothetical protein